MVHVFRVSCDDEEDFFVFSDEVWEDMDDLVEALVALDPSNIGDNKSSCEVFHRWVSFKCRYWNAIGKKPDL